MTGTPAKLTSIADGLRSLHGLLRFIKHPVARSHAAWRSLAARVERAGDDGGDEAREKLAALLRECMVNANSQSVSQSVSHYQPYHVPTC